MAMKKQKDSAEKKGGLLRMTKKLSYIEKKSPPPGRSPSKPGKAKK